MFGEEHQNDGANMLDGKCDAKHAVQFYLPVQWNEYTCRAKNRGALYHSVNLSMILLEDATPTHPQIVQRTITRSRSTILFCVCHVLFATFFVFHTVFCYVSICFVCFFVLLLSVIHVKQQQQRTMSVLFIQLL